MICNVVLLLATAFQDDGDPRRHWKRLERASIDRRNEALRRAVDEATARLEKNPADAAALLQRGSALLRLGEEREAIPDLKKASELNPANIEAHLALGEALLDRGEFESARGCFKRAVDLRPSESRALLLLGTATERDRKVPERYEIALQTYSRAIEADSRATRAVLARASVLLKLKRPEEARPDCDAVRNAVADLCRATYPDILAYIDSKAKSDVKEYREALAKALDKVEAYAEIRAADPEQFDLVLRLQNLERRSDELAQRVRGSHLEETRVELTKVLEEMFDLRQALQARELDELQHRIDAVRRAMKERAHTKSQVVADQLRELEKGESRRRHDEEGDD
jgi:tetratricopeptide (TPR) repeat protein